MSNFCQNFFKIFKILRPPACTSTVSAVKFEITNVTCLIFTSTGIHSLLLNLLQYWNQVDLIIPFIRALYIYKKDSWGWAIIQQCNWYFSNMLGGCFSIGTHYNSMQYGSIAQSPNCWPFSCIMVWSSIWRQWQNWSYNGKIEISKISTEFSLSDGNIPLQWQWNSTQYHLASFLDAIH